MVEIRQHQSVITSYSIHYTKLYDIGGLIAPDRGAVLIDGVRLEDFTPAELAELTRRRQDQTIERNPTLSEFPGATSPMHFV